MKNVQADLSSTWKYPPPQERGYGNKGKSVKLQSVYTVSNHHSSENSNETEIKYSFSSFGFCGEEMHLY